MNMKKICKVILIVIIFLIVFLILFVVISVFILRMIFSKPSDTIPPLAEDYPQAIADFKKHYPKEALAHFPDELPEQYSDYKFKIYNSSFLGDYVYKLSFKSNKEYVDKIKNTYFNKCIDKRINLSFNEETGNYYINDYSLGPYAEICTLHRKGTNGKSNAILAVENNILIFYAYDD